MQFKKNVRSSLVSLCVVLSVLFGTLPHSGAQDTNYSFKSTQLSSLPAKFSSNDLTSINQLGQVVATCKQQAQISPAQMTQLSTQLVGLQSGGDVSCPNGFALYTATMNCGTNSEAPGNFTCDSFKVGGGSFNSAALKAKVSEVNNAVCTNKCQQGKAQALQEEMKCLSQDVTQTSSTVESELQKAFQQNITKMQTDMSQMKTIEADRQKQVEFVNQKLNGNPTTGEVGWIPMQKEAEATYNNMVAEVAGIKKDQQVMLQKRQALRDMVRTRINALTAQCFMTTIGDVAVGGSALNYQCKKGQGQVTAYEWVNCQYGQNASRTKDGSRIDPKIANTASLTEKQAKLATLLNNILASAPKGAAIPSNAADVQKQATDGVAAIDPATVDKSFGGELAAFNVPGFDVRTAVLHGLASCNSKAASTVETEKTLANTALGAAQFGADQDDQALFPKVDSLYDKYSQSFSKVVTALNGVNVPLNIGNCRQYSNVSSAKLCEKGSMDENVKISCRQGLFQAQNTCLDQLRAASEGLLRGTVDANNPISFAAESTGKVPAQDASREIPYKCQGLNGCIRTYQNLSANVTREITAIGTYKKNYVMQANQNVQSYMSQMNTALKQQNASIQSRLTELNGELAKLGVGSATIKIAPIATEKLEKDEDGIFKLPENIVKISENGIGDTTTTFSNAFAKLKESSSKALNALNTLKALAVSCPKEGMDTLVQAVNTAAMNLSAKGCERFKSMCSGDSFGSQLGSIDAVSAKLLGVPGFDPSSLMVLQSGMIMGCGNPQFPGEMTQTDQLKFQGDIQSCVSTSMLAKGSLDKLAAKAAAIEGPGIGVDANGMPTGM